MLSQSFKGFTSSTVPSASCFLIASNMPQSCSLLKAWKLSSHLIKLASYQFCSLVVRQTMFLSSLIVRHPSSDVTLTCFLSKGTSARSFYSTYAKETPFNKVDFHLRGLWLRVAVRLALKWVLTFLLSVLSFIAFLRKKASLKELSSLVF